VKCWKETKGYDGKFEFLRKLHDTPQGAMLELVAEEKLVAAFKSDGASVRLCSAGLVRFNDPTKMKKVRRSGAKFQMVCAQIEEHEQVGQRLNKRLVEVELQKRWPREPWAHYAWVERMG